MKSTFGFDSLGRPAPVHFKNVELGLEIEVRPDYTWDVYRLDDPLRTPLDKSVVPADVRLIVERGLAMGRGAR